MRSTNSWTPLSSSRSIETVRLTRTILRYRWEPTAPMPPSAASGAVCSVLSATWSGSLRTSFSGRGRRQFGLDDLGDVKHGFGGVGHLLRHVVGDVARGAPGAGQRLVTPLAHGAILEFSAGHREADGRAHRQRQQA